jgi:hypothetical protein
MIAYRFDYLLDGEIVYAAMHEFADDLDALDTAEELAEDFEIEIFEGTRFVARIRQGRRPPDVDDALSG